MIPYTQNKQVLAMVMTDLEFDQYCGYPLTEEDIEPEEGYMVEHTERASNHGNHNGSIEWLPKFVFEFSHKSMGNVGDKSLHAQRMIAEQIELSAEITKLLVYIKTPAFFRLTAVERDLVLEQCRVMSRYNHILDSRSKTP